MKLISIQYFTNNIYYLEMYILFLFYFEHQFDWSKQFDDEFNKSIL